MLPGLQRFLFSIAIVIMFSFSTSTADADEPLVFISAFAAGDEGAIHAYRLDLKSGELKLVHRTTDVEHPFFLALSPDEKYLYSIHAKKFGGTENEHVAAYKIVGQTGQLQLLNRQSSLGTASCYLDVDATGKTVVVANYATGSVASLPVRADGSLGKASSFIQHKGSGKTPRQEGPHAHCIAISPDNRFAYAADLGLDQVLGYRLDAANAKLSPNPQPVAKTPPGSGPRHLTFHPNGKHVYAINELENSITAFDYDPETGLLIEKKTITTLPEDFDGTSYCADLKITPDGRFLYGTNRGHDSIAAYRLDNEGGLELLTIEPSQGKFPQNLAISPDGGLLLCANMPGNNIVVFRIDQEGGLQSVGEPISLPSPSCIMIR